MTTELPLRPFIGCWAMQSRAEQSAQHGPNHLSLGL